MVKIIITGDFCPRHRILPAVEKNEYQKIFNDFLPIVSEADLALTNLECPLVESGEIINKTGPCLKAPKNTAAILKITGFNLVTLANNHIMDYGKAGLDSTLESCKECSINFVGVGSTWEEAKKPFLTEIKGKSIAILNFCENEWATTKGKYPGANPLNPVTNYYDIRSAKAHAEYLIVVVHGGHEEYQYPSPRMKETYRFFIDAGADVVVGHHAHCFSGYEIYNKSPIFYGLGNFCFDWKGKVNSMWNLGLAVEIILDKQNASFKVWPYKQGDANPGIKLLTKEETKSFDAQIKKINIVISNDKQLEAEYEKLCRMRSKEYLDFFEPFTGKFVSALRAKRLLPSVIRKSKRKYLLNLIRCEAHRDIAIRSLESTGKDERNKG